MIEMEVSFTEEQMKELGEAISCYLDKLDDPDKQFLLREVINKLKLRPYLTDHARHLL